MNTPRVSIIVIFYNGGRYIREAVQSVLAQTWTDWELLLCDDGSSDAGTAIAKEYAARYPEKVRYLEHPNHENRGPSAARNLGLGQARGEYIAFLDVDDVYLPEYLGRQVADLEAHPEVAMVYRPFLIWHSWDAARREPDRLQDLRVPLDSVVQPPQLVRLWATTNDGIPGTCCVLIRRELLNEVGWCEEEFRTQFEDVIPLAKLCLRYPVLARSGCYSYYRQHDASCCATTEREGSMNAAMHRFLVWLEERSRQHYEGTEFWRDLQRQLWPYRHPMMKQLRDLPEKAARVMRGVAKCVLPGAIRRRIRGEGSGFGVQGSGETAATETQRHRGEHREEREEGERSTFNVQHSTSSEDPSPQPLVRSTGAREIAHGRAAHATTNEHGRDVRATGAPAGNMGLATANSPQRSTLLTQGSDAGRAR